MSMSELKMYYNPIDNYYLCINKNEFNINKLNKLFLEVKISEILKTNSNGYSTKGITNTETDTETDTETVDTVMIEGITVSKDELEKLCFILVETYNTTILDTVTTDIQDIFKRQITTNLYSGTTSSSISVVDKEMGKDGQLNRKRERDEELDTEMHREREKERKLEGDSLVKIIDQKLDEKCSILGFSGNKKVLKQLIDNHYNTQKIKPNYQYIGGPKTLTCHWSSFYKKVIYIFGEDHFETTDCPVGFDKNLIENYLEELIKNTDVFLDIYLELPVYQDCGYKYPHSECIPHVNQRIMKIGKHLHECVDTETRNANRQCDLSRIHYFDVRKSETKEKLNIVSTFISKVNTIFAYMGDYYGKKDIDNLLNITNEFIETLKIFCLEPETPEEIEKFNTFWAGQISSNLVSIKEFDKSFGVPGLVDFFKKELLLIAYKNNKKIKEYSTYIIEYYNSKDRKSIDKEEQFLDYYSALKSVLTENNYMVADVYTISRIFKKFNLDPDDPTKKRPTDEPIEPRNIIIYAGDFHSNNYRKFLNEVLGFKEIARVGKSKVDVGNPKACLDMTGFPQPFFSAWPPPSMPGEWISDYTNSIS